MDRFSSLCQFALFSALELVRAWLPARPAFRASAVRRVVISTLLISQLASFNPGHADAASHESPHFTSTTTEETTPEADGTDDPATASSHTLCPPYLSGGPGNPAIGSLFNSTCISTGTPIHSCTICWCTYTYESLSGDEMFHRTLEVDCHLFIY